MKEISKVIQLSYFKKIAKGKFVVRVLKDSAGGLLAKLFGMALTFSVHVLLARKLGSKNYGDYVYITTWLTTLSVIGSVGLDRATVKYVADYIGRSRWDLLKGFLFYSYRTVILITFSLAITALILINSLIAFNISNNHLLNLFRSTLPLLVAFGLLTLQNGIIRGLGKPVQANVLQSVIYPLFLGVFSVISITIFKNNLTAYNALVFNFLAIIFVVAIQAVVIGIIVLPMIRLRHMKLDIKEWFPTGLSLSVISGSELAMDRIGVMVLGGVVGTSIAGMYSIASRIIQILRLGLLAMKLASGHILSELFGQNRKNELQELVKFITRLGFVITMPVIIILFVFGDTILGLFGNYYIDGFNILKVLLIGELVRLITGPTRILMIMSNLQKALAIIMFLSLFGQTILLTLFLSIRMDVLGVALATSLTVSVGSVYSAYIIRKKLNIKTSIIP